MFPGSPYGDAPCNWSLVCLPAQSLSHVWLFATLWTAAHPPTGFSIHGIFRVTVLEWVVISFPRGSSWPREWTCISCIGRQILCHWAYLGSHNWALSWELRADSSDGCLAVSFCSLWSRNSIRSTSRCVASNPFKPSFLFSSLYFLGLHLLNKKKKIFEILNALFT